MFIENLADFNSAISFDTVYTVTAENEIERADGLYAPETYGFENENGEFELENLAEGWSYVSGKSGQYSYSGPIMHPSEFISAGWAKEILSNVGYTFCVTEITNLDDEDDLVGWGFLEYDSENAISEPCCLAPYTSGNANMHEVGCYNA